jgi:NTE family protein
MSQTLSEWLAEGPFTLSLSAGFFGFFAHAGFVAALEDAGLVPAFATGASAGALVSGLWAAGLSASCIERELVALRRQHFWDPGLGFGLLRGRRFRALLEQALPVRRFEQSPVPLAVSAYDCWSRRTVVLRSGEIAPAIHASCAYPGLFHPVWLAGRPLLDGGIADRAGVAGLETDGRVLHHHLRSRSPRQNAPAPRPHLRVVCIEGLPAVGPFQLAAGMSAFGSSWRAARAALDQPLADVIHVASR